MKSMNQLQTLRGSLVQLRKYWKIFYKLNGHKENCQHLGYPFSGTYSSQEQQNFILVKNIVTSPRYSTFDIQHAYTFICRCFDNNTEHEVCKYLLAKSYEKDYCFEDMMSPQDYVINKLCVNIMYYKKQYIDLFNKDFPPNREWQPNA